MIALSYYMEETNTYSVKQFSSNWKYYLKTNKQTNMKSLSVNSRGQDKNNCDREQALEEVRV